jgi:dienelactone hydrolase
VAARAARARRTFSLQRPRRPAIVIATEACAMSIADFEQSVFADAGISHRVYRRGHGPAVVLMHELPGLVDRTIAFAEEIAQRGFRVYMPLFFGEPGDKSPIRFFLQLCISREFRLFARGGRSPVVDWLRQLCRQAHAECGGSGVGVIGMCLTGNFAISLMADERVLAPVASQPALPMGFTRAAKASLGLPREDVEAARRRGIPLLGLRFRDDPLCPRERFATLEREVPSFRPIEITVAPDDPCGLSNRRHSVLTIDFCDRAGHPTRKARDEVLDFLHRQLKPDDAAPPRPSA